MNHSTSVWLVLLAAFILANLPFLNERWLALLPRRFPKTLWIRVLELLICYGILIGLGLALVHSAGQGAGVPSGHTPELPSGRPASCNTTPPLVRWGCTAGS